MKLITSLFFMSYIYEHINYDFISSNKWNIGSRNNNKYKYYEHNTTDIQPLIEESLKLYSEAINKTIFGTELRSNYLFEDDQIEFFTHEVNECLKENDTGKKLLNYIQDLVRTEMGCDFYPTVSPFSFWILEYNKGEKIKPHVDNELTQNQGLTVVIPLYVDKTNDVEYENSQLVPGNKIVFLPHWTTVHHTVENLGKRVVLQIKGSRNPFDSPVNFFTRKIKNFAYLKWYSFLPNNLITKIKKKGFLRQITTKNGVKISPKRQMYMLYMINSLGFLFGHYGKYIMYYTILLNPTKFRNHFKQMITILEIMNLIHFFSLLSYIWIHIQYSKIFLILLGISQILFISGFYRIGTEFSFFKTEIFDLSPNTHWIIKFPYTITKHPQLIGIVLSYCILFIYCERCRLYLLSQIICVLIYTFLECKRFKTNPFFSEVIKNKKTF